MSYYVLYNATQSEITVTDIGNEEYKLVPSQEMTLDLDINTAQRLTNAGMRVSLAPLTTTGAYQTVNVRGLSNAFIAADATLQRPNDVTPTVVSGAIGSAASAVFKFTNLFGSFGSNSLLTGLTMGIAATSITVPASIAIRAYLFNADVSALVLSANADKGVFKTVVAALPAYQGYVDFSTFILGGTGSDCIFSKGNPQNGNYIHMKAAAQAADLYAFLVSTAVYTPSVAASTYSLYASCSNL